MGKISESLKGIRVNDVGNEIESSENNYDSQMTQASFANPLFNGSLYQDYSNRLTAGNVEELDRRTSDIADYGSSIYDEDVMFAPTAGKIQDQRFNNQSGFEQIGAGLAKGVVTAGTTFLDGMATYTYGVAKGIYNKFDDDPKTGFIDGMWNNEISKALQSINEDAENIIKNYYSTSQENSPWYSKDNLLSANLIGDKFLKNLGFMVGAFGSGNVFAAASRLPRLIASATKFFGGTSRKVYRAAKTTAMLEGSLASAVSEGSIEALNGATEWRKTQIQNLDDKVNTELRKLNEIRSILGENEYNRRLEQIQAVKEQTLQKIDEDAIRMGNTDFLLNIPILTATNLFDWGRLYASGFKNATRFASKGLTQTGKGEGKTLVEKTINGLENKIKRPTARGIAKGTWRTLQEGREEMDQALAEQYAGLREQQDVDNYFRAALDGKAYERTYDNWKAAVDAWSNTYGNGDRWEEFAIGSISSMFGMPRVRGVKNAAGKFQSPITFEGGILQDVRESQEEAKKADDIIKYLKNRLTDEKFVAQFEGMTGHQYWQDIMDKAAEIGDKKTYKDAEVKQFVTDLTMMHKAGLLNNAEAIVDVMGDLSDLKFDNRGNLLLGGENTQENINNFELIKSNDKVKNEDGTYTSQRDWFDDKGNQKVSDKQIADDVNNRRKKILKYIDNYKRAIEDIDYESNGVLSDDQITELAWTKMLSFGNKNRAGSIINGQKDNITEFKTNVDARIESLRNKSLKNKNGENSLTEIEQKELDELEEVSRQLDEIINTNFEELEDEKKYKKHKDKINNLNKLIRKYSKFDEKGSLLASSYTNKDLLNEIYDANKLLNTSKLYDEKYSLYINNPGKLQEQIDEERERAENEQVDNFVKDIVSELKNADDIGTFESILDKKIEDALSGFEGDNETMWRIESKIRDRIEKSEEPAVKEMLKKRDYRNKLNEVVRSTFESVDKNIFRRRLTEEQKNLAKEKLNQVFNNIREMNYTTDDEIINHLLEVAKEETELKSFFEDVAKKVKVRLQQLKVNEKVNKQEPNPAAQEKPKQDNGEQSSNNDEETNNSLDFDHSLGLDNLPISRATEADKAARLVSEIKGILSKPPTKDGLLGLQGITSELVKTLAKNNSSETEYWDNVLKEEIKKYEEELNKNQNAAEQEVKPQQQSENPQAEQKPRPQNIIPDAEAAKEDNNDVIDDDPNKPNVNQDQAAQELAITAIDSNQTIFEKPEGNRLINTVKNWINTLYNFEKLKDRILLLFDGKRSDVQNFLIDHDTFGFIDKGGLADLNQMYIRREERVNGTGKPMPIKLIVNKGFKTAFSVKGKTFNTQDVIMAIEVDKMVDDYVKANFKDGIDRYFEVDGKQYLPIGVLGFYSNGIAKGENRENPSQKLCQDIKAKVKEDYESAGKPEWFVSKYTTQIDKIYSGRLVLTDEKHGEKIEDRDISETEFGNAENLIIGIGRSDGTINSPQLGDAPIQDLNKNNPTIFRAGSVWLMIKGADGVYYPMGCRVKRFRKEEYDWRNNLDSPIIQEMRKQAAILVDPNKTDSEHLEAKKAFEKLLGFPTDKQKNSYNPINYGVDEKTGKYYVNIKTLHGVNRINVNKDKNGEYLPLDDGNGNNLAVDNFMDELMSLNYRFGVSKTALKGDKAEVSRYLNFLINSHILTTTLLYNHNFCGSFDISKLFDEDGNNALTIETKEVVHAESNTGLNGNVTENATININGVIKNIKWDKDLNITNAKELNLSQQDIEFARIAKNILDSKPTGLVEHKGIFTKEEVGNNPNFVIVFSGKDTISFYTRNGTNHKEYSKHYRIWKVANDKAKPNDEGLQKLQTSLIEVGENGKIQQEAETNTAREDALFDAFAAIMSESEEVIEVASEEVENPINTEGEIQPNVTEDTAEKLRQQEEQCKTGSVNKTDIKPQIPPANVERSGKKSAKSARDAARKNNE